MTADYSAWANLYSRARPSYPAGLFEYLAGLPPSRDAAWDCATGNGQAARGLADHFERVVASDRSVRQLHEAIRHPRIQYRVASAERSALADASIDLVTVAAAIHWFDLPAFYRELQRVLRPGGVAAAWTYHVAHVESPVGDLLWAFYRDVVRSYFPRGADLVDEKYVGIHLPGTTIPGPSFWLEVEWDRDDVLAFVRSWSGTQAYMRRLASDPCDALAEDLARVFTEEHPRHRLRWPLYLRVSRV